MTDTPRDPLAARLRIITYTSEGHLEGYSKLEDDPDGRRLLATLDARPSGDEALRAAAQAVIDEGIEAAARGHSVAFTDGWWALRASLDAPVSPSPDVEGEEHCCNDPDHMSAEYLAALERERESAPVSPSPDEYAPYWRNPESGK